MEMEQGMVPVARAKRSLPVITITNSEAQTLRDCGYKWGLAYEQGLRPIVAPAALAYGTAVHAGLEAVVRLQCDPLFASASPAELVAALAPVAARAIAKRFGEWYKKRIDAGMAETDEAFMALAVEAEAVQKTASWMVSHYIETFARDWTNLIPLAVEFPFEFPLRNARGRVQPHTRWSGVIDLIAYDRDIGDIVVYDHKTTKGDVGTIDRRVELDPQMGGYLNALRELLAADMLTPERMTHISDPAILAEVADVLARARAGAVPTGRVIYNVLRKQYPREPSVNKNGRVSVASIDTLGSVYSAALVAQVRDRGFEITDDQRELEAKLIARGDTFLSRREFFRTDAEIERWRREAFVESRRMREAMRDPDARTRNPGHCTMPWSMPCVYRRLCLDPGAGEHLVHFERVPRHVEVERAREDEDAE